MQLCADNKLVQKTLRMLLLGVSLFVSNAYAEDDYGLRVYSASTQVQDDYYQLDTHIEYDLPPVVIEALESGVPLIFELEVDIIDPNEWLWNKVVVSYDQRYQVAYHALTQQYIVTNLNSGVQNSYSNRKTALLTMGRISNYPLIDAESIEIKQGYKGRVRVSLLINELPAPMRPWAFINSDWNLSSEWFEWDL